MSSALTTQKSYKVAFRRLRSKSFDGKGDLRRRKSAKPQPISQPLPPIEKLPEPQLQCKGSVILWRAEKSCEVFLFLHEAARLFEVVTIDRSTGVAKELNRLYVPQSGVESIVRETHYLSFVRSQRKDLVGRALLNGCISYIVETLDCTDDKEEISVISPFPSPSQPLSILCSSGGCVSGTVMRLQRYDGKLI